MKYLLIILLFCSCSKTIDYAPLLENKDWYLYKIITQTDTITYSTPDYWVRLQNGIVTDSYGGGGYYSFNGDTLLVMDIPRIQKYKIEKASKTHLTLKETYSTQFYKTK